MQKWCFSQNRRFTAESFLHRFPFVTPLCGCFSSFSCVSRVCGLCALFFAVFAVGGRKFQLFHRPFCVSADAGLLLGVTAPDQRRKPHLKWFPRAIFHFLHPPFARFCPKSARKWAKMGQIWPPLAGLWRPEKYRSFCLVERFFFERGGKSGTARPNSKELAPTTGRLCAIIVKFGPFWGSKIDPPAPHRDHPRGTRTQKCKTLPGREKS